LTAREGEAPPNPEISWKSSGSKWVRRSLTLPWSDVAYSK
jgi:hypothetical protein